MAWNLLLPLLTTIGGAALSSGRKKQEQTQTSTASGSRSGSQTGTIGDRTFQQETENPLLQPARGQGLNALLSLLGQQQKPVFGEDQIAQFLNQVNDMYGGALSNVSQSLAGVGALDSGRTANAFTGLESDRARTVGNFFMDLPFRERQAQIQNQLPLLQTLLGFTGSGPRGMFGESSRDVNMRTNETFDQTQRGNVTQQGPGFWTNFANNLGGLASTLGMHGLDQQKTFPWWLGGPRRGSATNNPWDIDV